MNPQTITAKDGTQLDASVVNLARAIRTVESGNNYEAKGASGEHGAYQWMPGNYEAGAKKYGLDPKVKDAMSQDKVAYNTIKEWKDKGLTPAQIASKWNSGGTEWEGKVGTNKYGVKYDVPAYVDKVVNAFRAVKAGQDPVGTATKPQPGGPDEPVAPVAAQEGYKPWFESNANDNPLQTGLKALGNVIPSAFNFGKNVVSALNPIETIKNIAAIPGEFGKLADEKGGALPALGAFFGELPKTAAEMLILKGTREILTGDIAGAGKTFTEDPFGQVAPYAFAAKPAARGVDYVRNKVATASYVAKGGIGPDGAPLPFPKPTNAAETAVESAVTGLARPVIDTTKAVASKVPNPFGRRAPADPEGIAGRIVQGDTAEAAVAAKVLPRIDTKGVKTYAELSERLDAQIKTDLKGVDAEYAAADAAGKPVKLQNLQQKVTGEVGGVKVNASINYVSEALKGLQELYTKTSDPVNAARIKAWVAKARAQGLTPSEINQIAREYGTEFGSKAFSKRTGDPLTSTNAQSFENIRSGVKTTARSYLKTDAAKKLDKGVSESLTVKRLVDDMVEKVNKLEQRVQKRNIMEKVGRALGTAVDMATFGGLRAFVARIFPSNVGLKVNNSIDLQSKLQGNLKLLDKLEGMDDATFANSIAGMIKSAGSALNQLPEANIQTKTPYVFGSRPKQSPAIGAE